MSNIVPFRLRYHPDRFQAVRWLSINKPTFHVENNGIGEDMFHGWRFIKSPEGIIYFADCIHAGITQDEIQP